MRLFLIIILIVPFSSLKAENIIILDTDEKYPLGKWTYVFADSSGNMTIDEVIAYNKFTPCNFDVYTGKPFVYTHWIRFNIKNTFDSSFCLKINNPCIYELDIYTINDKKAVHLIKTGIEFPFHKREILQSDFVFQLDLPKNVVKTYYIRYSATRRGIPLGISTLNKLEQDNILSSLSSGMLLGSLLIIVIYNFLLYIQLQDRGYLYYCIYILGVTIFRSTTMGYMFQFIVPSFPSVNYFIFFSSSTLACVFLILFAMEFLQIKKYMPQLAIVGYTFIAFFGAGFLFSFLNKLWSANFLNFAILLSSLYIVVAGIIVYRKNYLPARYYMIAGSGFLVGIFIVELRTFGILPHNFFTYNALNIGIVLEAILFSIALGERYKIIEKERRLVQQKLNKELENKIQEKVRNEEEQKKLNEELKNSHKDLDNFVYTASHDLKAPITNIEGLINLLKNEIKIEDGGKNILDMMSSSVENFKNTVNDLTEVTKVQKMRSDDYEENLLEEVINRVENNLKELIKKTNAVIYKDIPGHTGIKFSKRNFHRIMETLISNAIIFHDEDKAPEVSITMLSSDDYQIVEVKDRGVGISISNQGKIFKLFKKFHNKEGRGIELYITKRILENAGGKIEVKSEEGKGSVFRVYFRK